MAESREYTLSEEDEGLEVDEIRHDDQVDVYFDDPSSPTEVTDKLEEFPDLEFVCGLKSADGMGSGDVTDEMTFNFDHVIEARQHFMGIFQEHLHRAESIIQRTVEQMKPLNTQMEARERKIEKEGQKIKALQDGLRDGVQATICGAAR